MNEPIAFDDTLARYSAGLDDTEYFIARPRCWDCSTALAFGEGVELGGQVRCRDCNHEEVESRREEVTRC